jgi:hypothetical protein
MSREGVRQTGVAYVVSVTPDVCFTPMGAAAVPVPYPIIGKFDDAVLLAMSVRMCGRPTFTISSQVSRVQGDEAGTGGGVMSGVNRSTCESVTASATVRAEGNYVLRDGDVLKMNHGNTLGKVVYKPGVGTMILGSPPDHSSDPVWKRFGRGLWHAIKPPDLVPLDDDGNIIPPPPILDQLRAFLPPQLVEIDDKGNVRIPTVYDDPEYKEGGWAQVLGEFVGFLAKAKATHELVKGSMAEAAERTGADAVKTPEPNPADPEPGETPAVPADEDEDAGKTGRWQAPVVVGGEEGVTVTDAPERINLLDKSDPAYERSLGVKPVTGYRDVDIHANSQSFGVKINGKWKKLSVREVADRIRSSGPPGPKGYRLIGCEAGFEASGLAQQLADELGENVWAPDKIVGNFEDGTIYSGTKAGNSGRFRQFEPGGESPFIPMPKIRDSE